MARLKAHLAAPAALAACAGLSACGGIPGNAVVQVDGTPITKATFTHWMGVASASGGATGEKSSIPDPPNYTACVAHLKATAPKPAKGQKVPTETELKKQCETQYKSYLTEVIGFLISSSWVIGEGSSLGVSISDKEVHKQFEKIKSQQFPSTAEFQKFLTSSGQTMSDLLLRVKLSMLSTKIREKVAKAKENVSEAQVAKYYNENKSRYGTPEKRSVEIILTKTEAAAKSAKQEVQSGKSFASVAKKHSIDPTSKANGGLLAEVVKGEEVKELDRAIFSAAKGVLSGPVKTPLGYYVFRVKNVTPPTQQTLAQVKSTIKQQLLAQNQQGSLQKFVKEFEKKWRSKTECRADYMVRDCKGYKAPKGATGAAVP